MKTKPALTIVLACVNLLLSDLSAQTMLSNIDDNSGTGVRYSLTDGQTLQNTGTIASGNANAVEAVSGSTEINNARDALIQSTAFGIYVASSATATINNSGMIIGINNSISGICDDSGIAAITNDSNALIQGVTSGVALGYGGTVTNSGTIRGTLYDSQGILAGNAPVLIINASTGLIIGGHHGINLCAGGTIANSGTIASSEATTDDGIFASNWPAFVSNTTSAFIRGNYDGIWISGGGAVSNSGTILGIVCHGIRAIYAPVLITNDATGLIVGGTSGIYISQGGGITNAGAITGTNGDDSYGVQSSYESILVTNTTGGFIQGVTTGVYLANGGTAINSGTIAGINNSGINSVGKPAVITNTTSALIQGNASGIRLHNGGVITNSGIITGTSDIGFGIDSGATTLVINDAAGRIHGGQYGVNFDNSGAIINSGTIISDYSPAIYSGITSSPITINNNAGGFIIGFSPIWLNAGGTIANAGLITGITGSPYGVFAQGGLVSLLNSGTINGHVSLTKDAPNAVTLEAGGKITGNLNIAGAASTLTLDGAASTTQLYSAAVTGSTLFTGTLIKTGAGLWEIASAVNLAGFAPQTTLVQTGVLVAGFQAGSVVNSSTLRLAAIGASSFNGTLTNNGTLDFGSPATGPCRALTVGALAGKGTLRMTLNPATGDGDHLIINATAAATAAATGTHTLVLTLAGAPGPNPLPADTLQNAALITMQGASDATFAGTFTYGPYTYTISTTTSGDHTSIIITTPEPMSNMLTTLRTASAQQLKTQLESPGPATIYVTGAATSPTGETTTTPIIDLTLVNGATIAPGKTILGTGSASTIIGNLTIPANASNITILGVNFYHGELDITGARDIHIDNCTFISNPISISDNADNITLSWNRLTTASNPDGQITATTDNGMAIATTPDGQITYTTPDGQTVGYALPATPIPDGSAMLIFDAGAATGIILDHNLFSDGLRSDMPAAANARVLMFNNYFVSSAAAPNTNATLAAAGAQILSIRNIYQNVNNPLTTQNGGHIRAIDNFTTAITGQIASGDDNVFVPAISCLMTPADDGAPPNAATLATAITTHAGNTAGKTSPLPPQTPNATARISVATLIGNGSATAAGAKVDASVLALGNLTLATTASGFTPTACQWYLDNFAITNATGATHTVATTGTGAYSAALTTPAGEIVTTGAFTVTVNAGADGGNTGGNGNSGGGGAGGHNNSGTGGGGGGGFPSLFYLATTAALFALRRVAKRQ